MYSCNGVVVFFTNYMQSDLLIYFSKYLQRSPKNGPTQIYVVFFTCVFTQYLLKAPKKSAYASGWMVVVYSKIEVEVPSFLIASEAISSIVEDGDSDIRKFDCGYEGIALTGK